MVVASMAENFTLPQSMPELGNVGATHKPYKLHQVATEWQSRNISKHDVLQNALRGSLAIDPCGATMHPAQQM